MDGDIHVIALPDHARCRCGEQLLAGERAGFDVSTGATVCLYCLADRQAGRRPPRRRVGSAPVPTPTPVVPLGRTTARRTRAVPAPSGSDRPRRPGRALRGLVVAAALVGVMYFDNAVLGHDSPLRAFGVNQLPGVSSPGLDREIPVGADSTHYAFLAKRRPSTPDPVTWSPCSPIHVVVNKQAAPARADKLLQESLDRVSELSGLAFVVDGETDEEPIDNRPAANANPFKGRWRPALVAWTTDDVVPQLAGPVAGVGGPREAPASYPDERRFVSGIVYLDGPSISDVLKRRNGWAQARAIVMHELGHMVGLAHVDSEAELMDGDNDSGITDFGPGDRVGLRKLGSGPCLR